MRAMADEVDGAYVAGMERLVTVVQELSLARSLDAVMKVVRREARALTGADGATFVLRDNGLCFYADEDAISPLWKGQRFPLEACISGWSMLHKRAVVIPDIYQDSRIPHDAYRPTFVKSLVMVPIRSAEPIGAIGTYWAQAREATPGQVKLLQALADSASIALENVALYAELEGRVRERTAELEAVNRELEAFSYSVSHDLRAPLRRLDGFSLALLEDHGDRLDDSGKTFLHRIRRGATEMGRLIDALLSLARVSRSTVVRDRVDLGRLAQEVAQQLREAAPERQVELRVQEDLVVQGDRELLRALLTNLMSNAFKFTARVEGARVDVGRAETGALFVRDNGAGFEMSMAERLFKPFQRLHAAADYDGVGVGLATVQRIVLRHGGRIWAQAQPGKGATFLFTLTPAREAVVPLPVLVA